MTKHLEYLWLCQAVMSLLEVSSAKPFPFDYLQNKELMALSIVLLFLLPPGKIEHKLIFEAAEQTSN